MNSLILCRTKRNITIGCYSIVVMLACLGCKPTKDSFSASELQQEFNLQFGFPPGEDVADIQCKIVTIGDTVTQWMVFRANPETIRKMASSNFRRIKSDETYKSGFPSFGMDNPNAPSWWKSVEAGGAQYFYGNSVPLNESNQPHQNQFRYFWCEEATHTIYYCNTVGR